MNLTEEEEIEMYKWGVKFYDMGWNTVFKNIYQMGEFCKGIKADAVEKYIKEQRAKE